MACVLGQRVGGWEGVGGSDRRDRVGHEQTSDRILVKANQDRSVFMSQERKRKGCKVVVNGVSDYGCELYSRSRALIKDIFEERGLREAGNKKRRVQEDHHDVQVVVFSFSSSIKQSKQGKQDAAIIVQKSRNHGQRFLLPSFVNSNVQYSSGLTMHNLFSIVMRRHANSSSIISAPTRGGGSQKHLQTTRCEANFAVTEMATQVSNAMTIALARALLRNSDDHAAFDPLCKLASSPVEMLGLEKSSFLVCGSVTPFSESAPRFLSPHDLLDKVMKLCKAEVEQRVITSMLPQSTKQLQELTSAMVLSESDGGHVWRAIAIVQYLSTSEVGRSILARFGISRYAMAVVNAVASFSRFVVGNRARREAAGQSSEAKKTISEAIEATSKAASSDGPQQVDLSTISVAVAASRMRALTRRAQKQTTQLSILRAEDEYIYTGSGLSFLLDFTINALASPQAPFLKLLVSEKTNVSRQAGEEILNWQLGHDGEHDYAQSNAGTSSSAADVAENVQEASRNVAVSLRHSMLRILLQPSTQSPSLQVHSCRDLPTSDIHRVCGIASTHSDLPLAAEDSASAPSSVMVAHKKNFARSCKSVVAWVSHTCESDGFGVVEQLLYERDLEKKITTGERAGRAHRIHSNAYQHRCEMLSSPIPSQISGHSRSVVVFKLSLRVNKDMCTSAKAAAAEATAGCARASRGVPEAKATAPVSSRPLNVAEVEIASSPVTVGMVLHDAFQASISMCNKPRAHCLFIVAPHTEQQVKRELFSVPSMQPSCLLNVLDLKFEPRELNELNEPTASGGSFVPFAMSATLAADHPVPLSEAVHILSQLAESESETERRVSYLCQQRSLLLMGCVQALSLARTSNFAAARQITVDVANTHRLCFPDNHRHMFPTVGQLYVVGHGNLQYSFQGTPWSGIYGGSYETGAIGDVGIATQNITSDRRHVTSVTSQKHVDLLAEKVSKTCCVQVNERTYSEIPLELRGPMRSCVPGVHMCLETLSAAFESVRVHAGIKNNDTAMSIQCLPFSPMTEAVKPQVNARSVDPFEVESAKYIYDDATELRQSVLGPFFDSARVRSVSLADNPFESIEENMQVCILIASVLHCIEKHTKQLFSMDLKQVLESFFSTQGNGSREAAIYAVDIYVLFCCLFPTNFEVGKPVLPLAAQTLPRLVHKHQVSTVVELLEKQLVSDEAAADAMLFVAALTDDDEAWKIQTDVIRHVGGHISQFETCPVDKKETHSIIEAWARSVFDIHQKTTLQSPISDLGSRELVTARDLMPVFVDRPSWPDKRRQHQRGALLGIPMFGFIQVCTLLNAASTIDSTKVNWCRNEGGVSLRPSSCALKAEINGSKVSNKSISPVQSECDVEAFGTKKAKEDGARRQAYASEQNNLLLVEVTRHIQSPTLSSIRGRGNSQTVHSHVRALNKLAAAGNVSEEEVRGLCEIANAAVSNSCRVDHSK